MLASKPLSHSLHLLTAGRARTRVYGTCIVFADRVERCAVVDNFPVFSRPGVYLTPIGVICYRIATHDFPPFIIVDKSELSQNVPYSLACILCKPCPAKRLADLIGALCSQMHRSNLWNRSLRVHRSRLRQGWHHIQIGKSQDKN